LRQIQQDGDTWPEFQKDCPLDEASIVSWELRLQLLRNEILHLHKKGRGHWHRWRWSRESGRSFESSVGKPVRPESISNEELLSLLDKLEPWLDRHRAELHPSIVASERAKAAERAGSQQD
jgi:hypothetical protein